MLFFPLSSLILQKRLPTLAVETISDRYMATTNVASEQPDHHVRLCKFALAILVSSSDLFIDEDDQSKGLVKIRVRSLASARLDAERMAF